LRYHAGKNRRTDRQTPLKTSPPVTTVGVSNEQRYQYIAGKIVYYIVGNYNDALYKSTYTLLYFILGVSSVVTKDIGLVLIYRPNYNFIVVTLLPLRTKIENGRQSRGRTVRLTLIRTSPPCMSRLISGRLPV